MFFGKYDLLVNPPNELWNHMVQQIHDELSWKMSFHDYPSYMDGFGNDRFKFLVAVDSQTKKPAACLGGCHLPVENGSPQIFAIGMYYTHPDHRSSGLGRKMWEKLMEIAGGSNKFLNAAPVMSKKYAERSGFDKFAAWHLVTMVAQAKDCDTTKIEVHPSVKVVDFKEVEFEKVDKFDRTIGAGVPRGEFLKRWLTQDEAYNKFAVDESGEVVGYCNARIVYGNHILLSSFYANSPEIASTLMRKTLESVPDLSSRNELVTYMSTENEAGKEIFQKMVKGDVNTERLMPRQFDTKAVNSPGTKVYGVTETDFNYI